MVFQLYHFPYSDSEWRKISHQDKQRLGLTFNNDGEFYMNFNRDFIKYFGEVEIVHKTPEKMLQEQKSSTKYDVMYFQGEWTSQTAGGCGNDTIGRNLSCSEGRTYFLFFIKFCEESTICLHFF